MLVDIAVWAVLDRLHAERGAVFAADGLFGWACYLLLALIACALVARVHSGAAPTRALLVPALAASPYALAALWLAGDLGWCGDHPLLATALGVAYLAALAVRVLGAAFGPVRPRAALLAVALVLVAPWALAVLNLDTRLWVAPEAEQTQEEEDPAESEALLYDQPARIAAALEQVRPSEPGVPRAYFVGFAGDGEPAVFSHEALFARQVFAARFGTAERSVLLINDADDRDSYPLASLSGLTQALKLLATRMDAEQDVLVLFLTSHGSEEGLEVSNGGLPLAPFGPADLRRALDESGIKWRLVILSACYSGVFLDALKSDTTAIVTAADATHSSFGCTEGRDLTWFGEAFLRDALPGAPSLEEAFDKAARLIARREDAEHAVHSNPQLYVGELMRRKLRELDSARPGAGQHPFTARR
ncbi:MAG TPA: C13 family peptidase [Steroidobacteraceae bacterium]|nr:C13 family peptidase [Steroidobacteraceae bacterium]